MTQPEKGPRTSDSAWAPETIAARAGYAPTEGEGVAPPILPASTYVLAGDPGPENVSYTRAGSPAFAPLERALTELEGGAGAVVFSAGVAAAIALLEEARPGTAVVLPDDGYFGIRVHAQERLPRLGIEVRVVNQRDLAALERALSGASLLLVETPSNPLLAITDLAAVAELSTRVGVAWICDNTVATPVGQHPLAFGAAASLHSLTKYVGGHDDLIMGAAICADSDLAERLRSRRNDSGTQPDAFACWLAQRGLQTLALRVERQSANALELTQRLARHPMVTHVYYPGLSDAPGHHIAVGQMRGGFGSLLSILVKGGATAAQAVVDQCRLWLPATSLGGVVSRIERRARWTGEDVDPALLRLAVGIEAVDDLWRDLDRALWAAERS